MNKLESTTPAQTVRYGDVSGFYTWLPLDPEAFLALSHTDRLIFAGVQAYVARTRLDGSLEAAPAPITWDVADGDLVICWDVKFSRAFPDHCWGGPGSGVSRYSKGRLVDGLGIGQIQTPLRRATRDARREALQRKPMTFKQWGVANLGQEIGMKDMRCRNSQGLSAKHMEWIDELVARFPILPDSDLTQGLPRPTPEEGDWIRNGEPYERELSRDRLDYWIMRAVRVGWRGDSVAAAVYSMALNSIPVRCEDADRALNLSPGTTLFFNHGGVVPAKALLDETDLTLARLFLMVLDGRIVLPSELLNEALFSPGHDEIIL